MGGRFLKIDRNTKASTSCPQAKPEIRPQRTKPSFRDENQTKLLKLEKELLAEFQSAEIKLYHLKETKTELTKLEDEFQIKYELIKTKNESLRQQKINKEKEIASITDEITSQEKNLEASKENLGPHHKKLGSGIEKNKRGAKYPDPKLVYRASEVKKDEPEGRHRYSDWHKTDKGTLGPNYLKIPVS